MQIEYCDVIFSLAQVIAMKNAYNTSTELTNFGHKNFKEKNYRLDKTASMCWI